MKFDITAVYASACQYHVGAYLNNNANHRKILEGMMGKNASGNEVAILDNMVPEMIRQHAHTSTIVNLFYSELDPTYKKHIVDLKSDLDKSSIKYTVITDNYTDHGENGKYFSVHLKRIFS